MLINQSQQFVIEGIEDICPQMTSSLREGAGRDLPTQPGSACQQGKECIEFRLHRTADSGEQKSDQVRKGQITLASEIPWVAPRGFEERGALNVGSESV